MSNTIWAVDGSFFAQRLSGIQRYSIELLAALDRIVPPGFVEIVTPPGVETPHYTNIKVVSFGTHRGGVWQQLDYTSIPATDFYQLMRGFFDRLSQEKARRDLALTDVDGKAARQALARDAELAQKIAELRAQMKKELPFQRKAELNMKIKRIEQERRKIGGGNK